MSTVAPTITLRRNDRATAAAEPVTLERQAVLELAIAEDLATGMSGVAALIRRFAGAARVEWWAPGDDGALVLAAEAGEGRGSREDLPLGRMGLVAVFGGCLDPELATTLTTLTPIFRRRRAEEQLTHATMALARRNEALEDFAALVAHELKTPLHAALVADDAASWVGQALDLVDGLLQAAQEGTRDGTLTSAADPLEQAVRDLRVHDVEITAELDTALPIPAASLRVILRNLLANAIAAGALHIHVAAAQSSRSWRLFVDDDGVGLAEGEGYAAGSGLGLRLSRRIAARAGGALELSPRPLGGTRAALTFEGALQ